MNRKLVFIGMVVLALVLTSGTFAYTYTNQSAASITGTIADAVMTTYEPSVNQPNWNNILPEGEYDTEYLLPEAMGQTAEIPAQYPEEGEHWDKVDDNPADDSATYISTQGSNRYEKDLFLLSDARSINGFEDITGVTVHFRVAAGGGYNIRAMAEIVTNGEAYSGATETHSGTAWADYSHTWDRNPQTNLPWTWDEINELQAGVTMRGNSRNDPAVCTQVYVTVEYEFVVTQGAVPRGSLFDITPNENYTGDMLVKIYLTNTAELLKAYQYLNMKVYAENSIEASKTPDYQILSIETGVVIFNLEGGMADTYTIEINGGSYRLVSGDYNDWSDGWSLTPEFYCEVGQR